MRRVGRALATVLMTLAALMLLADTAVADTGGDEMAFVHRLNELRASRGAGPLGVRPDLVGVARGWSGAMAGAGGISHNPALGAQAPADWARLGENVGVGHDVQGLHDAFVASPSHYKNMVDPQFHLVGVGVTRGADGRMFVTVNFMTARAAAPAMAPAAAVGAAAGPAKKAVCKKARRGKVVCKAVKAKKPAKVAKAKKSGKVAKAKAVRRAAVRARR